MLDELIDQALQAAPLPAVLAVLERVTAYDRYQASQGIEQAAEIVAGEARRIGLSEVTIHRFAADTATRFWTFQAPLSWTPTKACLRIVQRNGEEWQLDHAKQPFLVATYSAPTAPGGINVRLVKATPDADLFGAVALVSADDYAADGFLRTLPQRGVLGFITDGPCCCTDAGEQFSGRIELEPTTTIFGMSVTSEQFQQIEALSAQGGEAHVELQVDRSAMMPVVSALLCPDVDDPQAGEVWLSAHLCHPRPGANDNASGVAALLGVAASLIELGQRDVRWQGRRDRIRLIWAPEFVGTAAFLNTRVLQHGAAAVPRAVLNLDMVGENQALCRSPFVVERPPESLPTLWVPLAESIVGKVFAKTADAAGHWRPTAFLGYSDHALFAGPALACPAIQFAHWPDRFNHSAADTFDKVSDVEMRRAIAAASVLVFSIASRHAGIAAEMPAIVNEWCAAEVARIGTLTASPDWHSQLLCHVQRTTAQLLAMLEHPGSVPTPCARPGGVSARWDGPINLRAMIASLPSARRAMVLDAIRRDKRMLAYLANFAVRADGSRGPEQIVRETALALGHRIDANIAAPLLAALFESGWVTS